MAPRARGDAFEGYQKAAEFSLPPGTAAFDALADGRIIAVSGTTVHVETAVRSRQFSALGVLPGADIPSFGVAFLKVSPDGSKLAVGNNGGTGADYEVGVFAIPGLTGQWLAASHFDAEWIDNARLAISDGDFVNPSVVRVLDTDSVDPQNPSNPVVIDGIGGSSGGVAFDALGNLYTGNGFQSSGPSGTGTVRAFLASAWTAAYQSSYTIDFESAGSLIVDTLSASPLGFDTEGNLIIGGGDFNEQDQMDYVGIARFSAVAAALGGGPPVDTGDAMDFRRLDPDVANDFNFFSFVYNAPLGELYVKDFGSDVACVYVDVNVVPAAGAWGLVCLSLLTATVGTVVLGGKSMRGGLGEAG